MSFNRYKDVIENGDTVILYLGYDNMFQFTVEKNKIHQTKYGALKHNNLIGKSFGLKVQCSKGYVYILHPTPELWTVNLPHRTQILYATDISLITIQLDLKPGSVVVESGTGSGSLSHCILRTIAPGGHLHTFDFHEKRVETATKEFEDHGFGDAVTVRHRDVCADGFDLTNVADAVFLDLPAPWEAVPHAKQAIKKEGGRICSFSPCIEQVQKTCEKLAELGFGDITTMECLLRPFDVRTVAMQLPDLGQGCWDNCPGTTLSESQGGSYQVPAIGQIEVTQEPPWKKGPRRAQQHQGKPASGDGGSVEGGVGGQTADSPMDDVAGDDGAETGRGEAGDTEVPRPEPSAHSDNKGFASYVFKSGLPLLTIPGHTGHLTFATLYPR